RPGSPSVVVSSPRNIQAAAPAAPTTSRPATINTTGLCFLRARPPRRPFVPSSASSASSLPRRRLAAGLRREPAPAPAPAWAPTLALAAGPPLVVRAAAPATGFDAPRATLPVGASATARALGAGPTGSPE